VVPGKCNYYSDIADFPHFIRFKNRYRLHDLARPEVRDCWVRTAKGMTDHPEIEGVFIDAILKVDLRSNAYRDGYAKMARTLRHTGDRLRFHFQFSCSWKTAPSRLLIQS
jgi:hypothetical protein